MEEPMTREAVMAKVSMKSAIQWCTYCKDICSSVMCSMTTQLGGPNTVVEVDETVAVKNKFGRGRPHSTIWMFGMYDRNQKKGYYQRVPGRSANTLIPIVQQWDCSRNDNP
ncbi:unnamed protein product [Echinostoma caproni]|uniref:DDE_Tnp_1_7 domain-containing protein n=1 Tax=Echinostoma caproni TaxID=27848 RepID=A0A183A081_9TREM|nr:unnamed protein product [Echinostoma caproni]